MLIKVFLLLATSVLCQQTLFTIAGKGDSSRNDGDGGPAIQANVAIPYALEYDEAVNELLLTTACTVRNISLDTNYINKIGGNSFDCVSDISNTKYYRVPTEME
jgi:hypothetical protein